MPITDRFQAALSDRYSIERQIGAGGMATVYLARDNKHDRAVALKVLRADLSAVIGTERFLWEIHIAAKLEHPHILTLIDSGEAEGILYYVLPYVRGESLRAKLEREKQLGVDEALLITKQVASALDYAHAQGVVHRDIKPENILFHEGEAVLADFGIALAVKEAGGNRLTETGLSLGTPQYMSPEQATGDRTVDRRSDIYSLGAVYYEMIAGEPPVTGATAQVVIAKLLTETPMKLRVVRSTIPEAVDRAVSKALAKVPADRFTTAGEFARALEAATPENSAKGTRSKLALALITAGIFAIAGLGAWLTSRSSGSSEPTTDLGSRAEPGVKGDQETIAVLPFDNMSGGLENQYFSDGMSEELIQALGSVRGLQVVARTSSFAFRGKGLNVQDIGARLHVKNILEGSVRQAGSRLRVSAELIGTANGYRKWSQTYERDARDVFAVQDDISRSIVNALRSTLGAAPISLPSARKPRDIDAYNLYLEGRYFWNKRTAETMTKAASFFEQAIRRDSTYAPAYSGYADAYAVIAALGFMEPRIGYLRAKPAAVRAISLDSTLAEAHASLGFIHLFHDYDDSAANVEFTEALKIDPRYATAHLFNAWYHLAVGDIAGAVSETKIARGLEPFSAILNTRVASMLDYAGRFNEAERQARLTIELDPGFAVAYEELARILAAKSDYQGSIENARRAVALSYARSNGVLGYSLAMAGERAEAEKILHNLLKKSQTQYVAPSGIGLIYAGLGEKTRALFWLSRSYAVDDVEAPFSRLDPLLKSLRSDSRFSSATAPPR